MKKLNKRKDHITKAGLGLKLICTSAPKYGI